ncbi:MAG TPA: MinD/ParA family protein [Rhodocyclaceae bacterium]|nr:MinD/ParA family protein [Rhodocyclaceae bacterium]
MPDLQMGDQAAGLRRLFGTRGPQVVAFASGREACGRTTLIVQTAAALAEAGHAVVIVDENPGPDNAIAAFGMTARSDLLQAVRGERSLRQVTVSAAPLIRIVPATRAAREPAAAAPGVRGRLGSCLRELSRGAAYVLVDCAHQRPGHLSPLALAARHMAIVVAAQGAAITHAYALIKKLARERRRTGEFQIAITRARSEEEARAIFQNMRRVAAEHLDVRLAYLGAARVPVTDHLADALTTRLPHAQEDGDEGWCLGPSFPADAIPAGRRPAPMLV